MLKLLLMENGGGEEPLSWVAWNQDARLNLPSGRGGGLPFWFLASPWARSRGARALLLVCLAQAWGRAEERVIDCLEEAILILEGLCIMEEMSIRKELTQIIRFLIERMGEGVF